MLHQEKRLSKEAGWLWHKITEHWQLGRDSSFLYPGGLQVETFLKPGARGFRILL